MGISFSSTDRFVPQESPTARKFQNIVKKINDHIRHVGINFEDPTPFEHDSKSIWWDDGAGSGKSVYEKLLEKRNAYAKNDKAATVIISHDPDDIADGELYNQPYVFICDGSNDTEVIQRAVNAILLRGSGKIFLKAGVYNLTESLLIRSPLAANAQFQTNIQIEGERGTVLLCKTGPPSPGVFISILGEQHKRNQVIFHKIAFFSDIRKSARLVQVEPQGEYGCAVIFEKCTFSFGENGPAFQSLTREDGTETAYPTFRFDRCHFRRRRGNFYSYGIDVSIAAAVDITDCSFYDTKTCSESYSSTGGFNRREKLLEAEAYRWRSSYVPLENSFSSSAYVYVDGDDETLVQVGSSDYTLVAREFISLANVDRIRIIGCDFKHHDTAIRVKAGDYHQLLVLHSNTFYQLGAFLATAGTSSNQSSSGLAASVGPGSAIGRGFVKSDYNSCVAVNNIFYGAMHTQSGFSTPRPVYPVLMKAIGSSAPVVGSLAFVYNIIMQNAKGTGVIYPNFMPDSVNPLRLFRVWKTERDRINLAYPDSDPIQGGASESAADDTFDSGIQKYNAIDPFGNQIPAFPWCTPK